MAAIPYKYMGPVYQSRENGLVYTVGLATFLKSVPRWITFQWEVDRRLRGDLSPSHFPFWSWKKSAPLHSNCVHVVAAQPSLFFYCNPPALPQLHVWTIPYSKYTHRHMSAHVYGYVSCKQTDKYIGTILSTRKCVNTNIYHILKRVRTFFRAWHSIESIRWMVDGCYQFSLFWMQVPLFFFFSLGALAQWNFFMNQLHSFRSCAGQGNQCWATHPHV